LLFVGAMGKSAQFLLHTWLPDAMEGPTPVSALIHAATMVAAGVFLVGRFFPLFQESQPALTVVALIGAFTAFMAATMGLVMNDIKRVMAYSTISQLGYMMAALGVGAFGAALFHLFTHAFFKALLFLGAGSVNHASGTFNMRYMGGLGRHMPWTYAVTLIGGLSLVGVIPFAGFWSKDEILTGAFLGSGLVDRRVSYTVFGLLLAAVLLTAFYTFRMIYLTFHGEFRGGGEREIHDAEQANTPHPAGASEHVHLGESPAVMVAPMVFLAFAAIVTGYLVNPQWVESFLLIPQHWITEYLSEGLAFGHLKVSDFNVGMAVASNVVALVGIVLASLLYLRRREGAGRELQEPLEKAGPVYDLLYRKYYMDDLYEDVIVRRWFYRRIAAITDWLDRNLLDGFVDLIGGTFRNSGRALALLQTGQVQFYGTVVVLGSIIILVGYLIFGPGV
jgi:NADH-quinone oxidoreductase subunit L